MVDRDGSHATPQKLAWMAPHLHLYIYKVFQPDGNDHPCIQRRFIIISDQQCSLTSKTGLNKSNTTGTFFGRTVHQVLFREVHQMSSFLLVLSFQCTGCSKCPTAATLTLWNGKQGNNTNDSHLFSFFQCFLQNSELFSCIQSGRTR